jgi:hypothetical protein
MAIRTTVYVTYDTLDNKLTLTGGNTTADDGTVNFDVGPGNKITFEPAGDNVEDWTLDDITWSPASPDVLEWVADGANLVLTDNNNEEVKVGVDYEYTLHATALGIGSDPVIIHKRWVGVAQMRMSGSQKR